MKITPNLIYVITLLIFLLIILRLKLYKPEKLSGLEVIELNPNEKNIFLDNYYKFNNQQKFLTQDIKISKISGSTNLILENIYQIDNIEDFKYSQNINRYDKKLHYELPPLENTHNVMSGILISKSLNTQPNNKKYGFILKLNSALSTDNNLGEFTIDFSKKHSDRLKEIDSIKDIRENENYKNLVRKSVNIFSRDNAPADLLPYFIKGTHGKDIKLIIRFLDSTNIDYIKSLPEGKFNILDNNLTPILTNCSVDNPFCGVNLKPTGPILGRNKFVVGKMNYDLNEYVIVNSEPYQKYIDERASNISNEINIAEIENIELIKKNNPVNSFSNLEYAVYDSITPSDLLSIKKHDLEYYNSLVKDKKKRLDESLKNKNTISDNDAAFIYDNDLSSQYQNYLVPNTSNISTFTGSYKIEQAASDRYNRMNEHFSNVVQDPGTFEGETYLQFDKYKECMKLENKKTHIQHIVNNKYTAILTDDEILEKDRENLEKIKDNFGFECRPHSQDLKNKDKDVRYYFGGTDTDGQSKCYGDDDFCKIFDTKQECESLEEELKNPEKEEDTKEEFSGGIVLSDVSMYETKNTSNSSTFRSPKNMFNKLLHTIYNSISGNNIEDFKTGSKEIIADPICKQNKSEKGVTPDCYKALQFFKKHKFENVTTWGNKSYHTIDKKDFDYNLKFKLRIDCEFKGFWFKKNKNIRIIEFKIGNKSFFIYSYMKEENKRQFKIATKYSYEGNINSGNSDSKVLDNDNNKFYINLHLLSGPVNKKEILIEFNTTQNGKYLQIAAYRENVDCRNQRFGLYKHEEGVIITKLSLYNTEDESKFKLTDDDKKALDGINLGEYCNVDRTETGVKPNCRWAYEKFRNTKFFNDIKTWKRYESKQSYLSGLNYDLDFELRIFCVLEGFDFSNKANTVLLQFTFGDNIYYTYMAPNRKIANASKIGTGKTDKALNKDNINFTQYITFEGTKKNKRIYFQMRTKQDRQNYFILAVNNNTNLDLSKGDGKFIIKKHGTGIRITKVELKNKQNPSTFNLTAEQKAAKQKAEEEAAKKKAAEEAAKKKAAEEAAKKKAAEEEAKKAAEEAKKIATETAKTAAADVAKKIAEEAAKAAAEEVGKKILTESQTKINTIKTESQSQINKLKTESQSQINKLKEESQSQISKLKSNTETQRQELNKKISNQGVEVQKATNRMNNFREGLGDVPEQIPNNQQSNLSSFKNEVLEKFQNKSFNYSLIENFYNPTQNNIVKKTHTMNDFNPKLLFNYFVKFKILRVPDNKTENDTKIHLGLNLLNDTKGDGKKDLKIKLGEYWYIRDNNVPKFSHEPPPKTTDSLFPRATDKLKKSHIYNFSLNLNDKNKMEVILYDETENKKIDFEVNLDSVDVSWRNNLVNKTDLQIFFEYPKDVCEILDFDIKSVSLTDNIKKITQEQKKQFIQTERVLQEAEGVQQDIIDLNAQEVLQNRILNTGLLNAKTREEYEKLMERIKAQSLESDRQKELSNKMAKMNKLVTFDPYDSSHAGYIGADLEKDYQKYNFLNCIPYNRNDITCKHITKNTDYNFENKRVELLNQQEVDIITFDTANETDIVNKLSHLKNLSFNVEQAEYIKNQKELNAVDLESYINYQLKKPFDFLIEPCDSYHSNINAGNVFDEFRYKFKLVNVFDEENSIPGMESVFYTSIEVFKNNVSEGFIEKHNGENIRIEGTDFIYLFVDRESNLNIQVYSMIDGNTIPKSLPVKFPINNSVDKKKNKFGDDINLFIRTNNQNIFEDVKFCQQLDTFNLPYDPYIDVITE